MIIDINKFPPHIHVVQPFEHQLYWLEKTWSWEAFGFLWEMGCGKSKPILDTITKLYLAQEIDGALILSDKGCYLGWVYDHIPTHMQRNFTKRVSAWKNDLSKREALDLEDILRARDDVLDILVMNIESFVSKRALDVATAFLLNHHAMMAIDESTSIKNPRAQRTQKTLALASLADYRRIATGTPMTNNPLDLFTQFQFLKKGCLGFTAFSAFRSYYAEIRQQRTHGGKFFPQIVGYRNLDQLTISLQPYSSRILKKECLDLPEKIYETIYVEMSPEQREAYDSLKSLAMIQLDQGLVTATDALQLLNKLQQITCGFVKDDEGHVIRLVHHRVEAMLELIEKIEGKVVIWCKFHEDISQIHEALTKAYGEASVALFYGKTSDNERRESLRRFVEDDACRFFVATEATGGKGINELVIASTMIYYSTTFNLMNRLQSEDRLHRPGQVNNVTIFDLVILKTVDVKVIDALHEKRELSHQILDKIRDLLA